MRHESVQWNWDLSPSDQQILQALGSDSEALADLMTDVKTFDVIQALHVSERNAL